MRKLIGIGVGPGAEDLITLRALRYLERADHIFVPRNKGKTRAYDIVKDFIDEEKVVFLEFPMGEDIREIYEDSARLIDETTKSGELSVLITLGDGTIYTTLLEVFHRYPSLDIQMELVPGIPAFLAAINGIVEALVKKGDSFLLVDNLQDEENVTADMVAVLKTTKGDEIFSRLRARGYYPLYFENIETDHWFMTDDSKKCEDRKAYMSLILGRKEPWNMAVILNRIGDRIKVL